MNYFQSVSRYIAGGIAAVAFLAVPVSFAYASVSVSIEALSPSTNLTVGQSVSFIVAASGFLNPTYAVSDSLSGSSVSSTDIDSSGDFSWTPGNSDIGTHNLTITVSDSQGDTATTEETIMVSAPAAVSIQALSPSSTVIVGQTLSFFADVSGFTNPTYSLGDSFSGSTLSNSDINSSGNVSWVPTTSSQDGSHAITVYVSDSLGHTAQASETVTVESAPTVVIGSLSPGATVAPGQTLTFTATAANVSGPTYTLSDSYNGSSLNNSDINSSGNVSWTPGQSDYGTHTITVFVTDSSGHSATASQTITVSGTPVASGTAAVQGLSPGSNVIIGQPVTFTIAAPSFTNPIFSIGDSFGAGSSVSNSDINSAGYFSWTPSSNDIGTHNLTIYINDSSGHTGNITVPLTVGQANLNITSITPGTTVIQNSPLSFTISPAGFTNPNYTVSDSFGGTSVTDSDINSSGNFSWTPTSGDDGTHTITIYATDPSGHSANTSIAIDVISGVSSTVTAPASSTTTLGQLEAELQADETAIDAAGGAVSGASTSYVFSTPLSQGMTSSQVTQLQTVLDAQGDFSGTATGYYGSLTTAAVEKFQAAHGIAQVGTVGPLTMAALNALMVPAGTTTAATSASSSTTVGDGYVFSNFIGYGDMSNDVTELQKRLTAFGDYSGSITGYFGSLTRVAVEKFQGEHGIDQVGYVGPGTRAALNQ